MFSETGNFGQSHQFFKDEPVCPSFFTAGIRSLIEKALKSFLCINAKKTRFFANSLKEVTKSNILQKFLKFY